jgi:hypothetical protein
MVSFQDKQAEMLVLREADVGETEAPTEVGTHETISGVLGGQVLSRQGDRSPGCGTE